MTTLDKKQNVLRLHPVSEKEKKYTDTFRDILDGPLTNRSHDMLKTDPVVAGCFLCSSRSDTMR